jgi:HD superfamily phosphohydrolase
LSSTVVRDPIHGMVELSPDEWKAVDTPVFQRLRFIRQLALTYLVYPSALHTRFEHSIGVRYVANALANRLRGDLKLKAEDLTVLNGAALLHDVGHGVFSHVSEQVIDELSGTSGVHEAVSAHIMRTSDDLHTALGKEVCERAADLVALKGPRTALGDIVSGPTDADKLDYLLRDSHFAGVNYGRYDLGRITDSARVISPGAAQTQLGFDAGGLWAVEELLVARHHMHRQVYGHKTRLATDIMVTRALKAGVEDGALPERAYKVDVDEHGAVKVSDEFLEAYLEQTDVLVLERLRTAPAASAAADLASRLLRRELLRQTVSIRLDERTQDLGDARYARIRDPEEFTLEIISSLEATIADDLGVPLHLVAIHLDSHANPTYRNPGARLGRKDIMIQRDGGEPRLLHRESEIFSEMLGPDHVWIYLYTPRLDDDERDQQAKDLLWNALLRL